MSDIAALRTAASDASVRPAEAGDEAATRVPAPRDAAAAAAAAALVWQWRRPSAGAERAKAAAAARKKGAIGGVIGLAVATAIYFWRPRMGLVVGAVAVLITLLALVSPLGGYRQLMRAVDAFARWVGTTMTWLLMSVAWLLVFLPVGLVLRAGHKLRITRAPEPRLPSYWSAATKVDEGIAPYQKPF